ncbi:MAG: RNA polymerase sigma factor [Deltaproteobacteria bacterium]
MEQNEDTILKLIRSERSVEKGFRMLMNLYQSRLYNLIRSIVGDHDDADDVLQNTFIKAYRNINSFEERSALSTWLFRIATNESLTYIQSNKKKKVVESLEAGRHDIFYESVDISGEFIQTAIDRAIEELPHQQKAIFSLRYYEEMNYNDMSSILDVSVGALKASYHHAVKKIENHIKLISENHY